MCLGRGLILALISVALYAYGHPGSHFQSADQTELLGAVCGVLDVALYIPSYSASATATGLNRTGQPAGMRWASVRSCIRQGRTTLYDGTEW